MIDNDISVIIPCYPLDMGNVGLMLESLRCQTRPPGEVIVALSETSKKEGADLARKYLNYPFPVKFCTTEERQFAGQNRNRGAEIAEHGIFVFCDADDVCHPQKIEITKDVFSKYNPKLFLHGFKRDDCKFEKYDKNKIPFIFSRQLMVFTFGTPPKRDRSKFIFFDRPATEKWMEGAHPHHGYPAVRRDVFEKVKYGSLRVAEDTSFCLDVLWQFKSAVYADISLVNYIYANNPKRIQKTPA